MKLKNLPSIFPLSLNGAWAIVCYYFASCPELYVSNTNSPHAPLLMCRNQQSFKAYLVGIKGTFLLLCGFGLSLLLLQLAHFSVLQPLENQKML